MSTEKHPVGYVQPAEVVVPDTPSVFLGISAANYAAADDALWALKSVFGDRDLSPMQRAHLNKLRERRKDAYADLVTWALAVEAERLGVPSTRVVAVD